MALVKKIPLKIHVNFKKFSHTCSNFKLYMYGINKEVPNDNIWQIIKEI